MKTLYSRDSKGKLLQWKIEIKSTGFKVDILKSYGEVDGGQALRWQRDIQGKNIGKANETTPLEQAQLICESNIKRKKDKGYIEVEFPNKAMIVPQLIAHLESVIPKYKQDADGNVKPMKCQQYYRSKKDWIAPDGTIYDDRKYYYLANPYVEKEPKAIITRFPSICQAKINGVRATIQIIENKAVIKSKEGLIYQIPHILDYCNTNLDLFKINKLDLVLDGELYIHGEILADISSAVKKVSLITQRLVFVLFDLAIPEYTQRERWNMIKDIRTKLNNTLNSPIEIINSFVIKNDSDAQKITDQFISKGYEGSIFRDFDATYKFGGRPMSMTKLKRTLSDEFTIIDILPQEKDVTKGNFQCISEKGEYFQVNPGGTDEYKKELLINKEQYKGRKLSCVFYEWTADRKPFHVIENHIRDYE